MIRLLVSPRSGASSSISRFIDSLTRALISAPPYDPNFSVKNKATKFPLPEPIELAKRARYYAIPGNVHRGGGFLVSIEENQGWSRK